MRFEVSVLDVLKRTVKEKLSPTKHEEEKTKDLVQEVKDEAKKVLPVAAVGAGVGAGTYATIGGLGLVGLGTAVGITLVPMMVIGGTLAAGGYGLYRLGRREQHSHSQVA